jgi:hypothetical protein
LRRQGFPASRDEHTRKQAQKVNLAPGPAHAREHAYELTLLNRCKCTQACKGKLMRDPDRVAGPEDPRSLRIENAGDLG